MSVVSVVSGPTGVIRREVEVRPTVEELARCFSEMGSDEQAKFFDTLDYLFDQFGSAEYLMQACQIVERLSPVGRIFVTHIALFLKDPEP